MADTLIYIPNNNTQIYPFCRLQLVVETFGFQIINEQTNHNPMRMDKKANILNYRAVHLLRNFGTTSNTRYVKQ